MEVSQRWGIGVAAMRSAILPARRSFVLQLPWSSVYRLSPFALAKRTKPPRQTEKSKSVKKINKINQSQSFVLLQHNCRSNTSLHLSVRAVRRAQPEVFNSHFAPPIKHNEAFDSAATELCCQYAPDEPISPLLLSAPV